ncbi:hypothetical protein [Streptomyces sp. 8N706]|uniref:hypothetical protein n=1 Tax=Streptomyces sp. 8N706 TaxID=3457416 RepID=UPI003FD560CF
MRGHEFEPGKLIAGIVLLVAAVIRALDAAGEWETPVWVLVPVVVVGLSLAGLASFLSYAYTARRRPVRQPFPPDHRAG